MPDKSLEELLNEPVFVKIPRKEGDIRINVNKLIYLLNTYDEYNAAFSILSPILERWDGSVWGIPTKEQVFEWAKRNKEE